MGKYFKYAIGEILLVVIGILIALQINNWNENLKAKNAEAKLISELLDDVKNDSTFYHSRHKFYTSQVKSYQTLKELCSGQIKASDSIVFYNESIPLSTAANESMVINNKNDYNKITNSSIKQALRDYTLSYSYTNLGIQHHSELIKEEFEHLSKSYNLILPYSADSVKLNVFSTICDNPKIAGTLHLCREYSKAAGDQTGRFIKSNQNLINACKSYLND
ncbi:DUF6090 family protein [Psychroserpens sp.]|uniref:DUF6090 family protein n=1 Tax=Psychroserpens sp. TaxID=2020870 RepID=UPI0038585C21